MLFPKFPCEHIFVKQYYSSTKTLAKFCIDLLCTCAGFCKQDLTGFHYLAKFYILTGIGFNVFINLFLFIPISIFFFFFNQCMRFSCPMRTTFLEIEKLDRAKFQARDEFDFIDLCHSGVLIFLVFPFFFRSIDDMHRNYK